MIAVHTETAADVMHRDVVTVGERWDIRDALKLFQERRISGAPVIDDDGDLVGVLSIADIARGQAERHARSPREDNDFYRTLLPGELPPMTDLDGKAVVLVSEAMTPLVIDAPETTPVPRLAALMMDLHIHRVIITHDGKLCGIVSSLDLLRLLRAG